MRLITNSPSPTHRQLVLLAPSQARVPQTFRQVDVDANWHQQLLSGMQRLRGEVYLKDGAIEKRDLTEDGRHRSGPDEESWHLLAIDGNGEVCGCARYREHENTVSFSQLGIVRSALAQCDKLGGQLRSAVEAALQKARPEGLSYVECGGWALAEHLRCSTEAVRTALSTYALAQMLGGCLGISTVTMRHCSASILRRIGGRSLEAGGAELPSYYDPQYKCEMAMLRFDSRAPNPKYRNWIEDIGNQLLSVPVICQRQIRRWDHMLEGLPPLSERFAAKVA
jgi:predicted GNAT family N-acyltransferase